MREIVDEIRGNVVQKLDWLKANRKVLIIGGAMMFALIVILIALAG